MRAVYRILVFASAGLVLSGAMAVLCTLTAQPDLVSTVVCDSFRVTRYQSFGYEVVRTESGLRPVLSRSECRVVSAGWPAKAFIGQVDVDSRLETNCLLFLSGASSAAPNEFGSMMPLHPSPRGILINTVFFGLVAWSMGVGVGRIRRNRRRASGLCQVCAYPTPESGACPECGSASMQTENVGTSPTSEWAHGSGTESH